MEGSIGWNFPGNNDGQINGIADAGVETFKGSPKESLTREICQNSLDAFDDTNFEPVKIEFCTYKVATKQIPDYQQLVNAYNECHDFWKNNEKAFKFFYEAKKILQKRELYILRISDFNTKGLVGSDKAYGTPWQNLVKSSGVSDKGGTAGGSFGIGKSAPFACSKLRTVFYRTLDIDGVNAVQGISRIASFERLNENRELITTTGVGYYGKIEKNQPIPNVMMLDDLYHRDRKGTDIFIIGFDWTDDWENQIVNCLVEEFLLSFVHGKLEVKVGEQCINKKSIGNIINMNKKKFKNAYSYYQVLDESNNTYFFKEDFKGLGTIKLRVLLGDNLNRKVLISRSNGMKLRDMGNISNILQFSAIFQMEGEDIISYFRRMENPQHDRWEADRVKDYGGDVSEARKVLRELNAWIKSKIQELGKYESGDNMDAQGVGNLIPDFFDFDKNSTGEAIEESLSNVTKDFEVQVAERPLPKQQIITDKGVDVVHNVKKKVGVLDEEGEYNSVDVPHNKYNNSDGGLGAPAKATHGDGNRPFEQNIEVKTYKIRMFVSDVNKNEYTLSFYSSINIANASLEIRISGEQSEYDANIKKAVDVINKRVLNTSNNKITLLKINKDTINRIKFELMEEELFSLEVKLYAN